MEEEKHFRQTLNQEDKIVPPPGMGQFMSDDQFHLFRGERFGHVFGQQNDWTEDACQNRSMGNPCCGNAYPSPHAQRTFRLGHKIGQGTFPLCHCRTPQKRDISATQQQAQPEQGSHHRPEGRDKPIAVNLPPEGRGLRT